MKAVFKHISYDQSSNELAAVQVIGLVLIGLGFSENMSKSLSPR